MILQRYFIDTGSIPRQCYAAFQEGEFLILVNVERPTIPPYCLSLAGLFAQNRFEEVGVVLDDSYNPVRFKLKTKA